MKRGMPYSHRRIVWFALGAVLLFPFLTGCFSSDKVSPPLDHFNIEFKRLLTLGSDNYKRAIGPESLAFVDDTTLAIGTEDDGVYLADLSDPAEPAVVSVFKHEGAGIAKVVAMDGFVYGFAPSSEFLAIDAREPAAPKLASVLPGQEEDPYSWRIAAWPLTAEGGFLYLRMHGGIHIYNAADPYSLSLEGVYYPPQTRARGPFMGATVGVNPTLPQLEAEMAQGTFMAHDEFPFESLPCSRRYVENGELLGLEIQDSLLYVRVGYAYCVGPEQEVWGYHGPRGGTRTPKYAPVRQEVEDGGLWVLDVSDPAEPLAVAFLPLQFHNGGNRLPDVTVSSDYVYLSSQGSLFDVSAIVDMSEPGRPVLSERQLNANLAIREDSLLFASIMHVHSQGFNPPRYSNGLQIFDVSDAANPILIGMMSESPGTEYGFMDITDIAVRDDYIFVAQSGYHRDAIHVLRLIDRNWRPDDAPEEASGD